MRRFIVSVLVLVAVVVIAVGFSRGWFEFSTGSQDEKSNITLTVDKDKLRADKEKAVEGIHGLTDKLKTPDEGDKGGERGPLR